MFSPSLRLMLALIVFLIATTCRAGTYIDGAGATLSSATNNNQLLINIQDTALGINMNYGYSGFVNWTQNNGSNTFTTFCIELNQDVYFGTTYNFTVTSVQNAPHPGPPSPMGLDKANAIRALWAQNYSTNMDQTTAAAFQLAIWRIEYDFSTSNYAANGTYIASSNFAQFSTGNFMANSNGDGSASTNAISDAIGMLQNLNPNGPMAEDIYALTGSTFQDQITQIAPEPTTLCLGVIGGLVLTVVGYRRRKVPLENSHQSDRFICGA